MTEEDKIIVHGNEIKLDDKRTVFLARYQGKDPDDSFYIVCKNEEIESRFRLSGEAIEAIHQLYCFEADKKSTVTRISRWIHMLEDTISRAADAKAEGQS